jgi:hypothetical protein
MEEKNEIHAVELVRHIRDQQAELLEGKSPEEIIDFFRKAGEAAGSGTRRSRKQRGEPTAAPNGVATR